MGYHCLGAGNLDLSDSQLFPRMLSYTLSFLFLPLPRQLRITVWSLCTKSVSYIKYPKACQQGESSELLRGHFSVVVWGFGDLFILENFKHRQK